MKNKKVKIIILMFVFLGFCFFLYIGFQPLDKNSTPGDKTFSRRYIKEKLETFNKLCGHYPSSSEGGLSQLLSSSSPECFRSQEIGSIPFDEKFSKIEYVSDGKSFNLIME